MGGSQTRVGGEGKVCNSEAADLVTVIFFLCFVETVYQSANCSWLVRNLRCTRIIV
jgi:hypothetical protein